MLDIEYYELEKIENSITLDSVKGVIDRLSTVFEINQDNTPIKILEEFINYMAKDELWADHYWGEVIRGIIQDHNTNIDLKDSRYFNSNLILTSNEIIILTHFDYLTNKIHDYYMTLLDDKDEDTTDL